MRKRRIRRTRGMSRRMRRARRRIRTYKVSRGGIRL